MSQEAILKKIRRLLELSSSPNENEARAAMEKANELLVKHNLRFQTIECDIQYQKRSVRSAGRNLTHHRYLAQLLMGHFFVSVVHTRKYQVTSAGPRFVREIVLIGEMVNCEIATYVFAFLDAVYPQLWKKYRRGRKLALSTQKSYYRGLSHGIALGLDRVRAAAENERGLALIDDPGLEKYVDEFTNGKSSKPKPEGRSNRKALWDGYIDGGKVNIMKPLASSAKTADLRITQGECDDAK